MDTNQEKSYGTLPVIVKETFPIEIQRELQIKTRYTIGYLTDFMSKYNLSPGDLVELAKWNKDYGIDFTHIGKLRDRGYNLEQIEQLLEAREMLTQREIIDNKEKLIQKPSIEQLIRLSETFSEIEIDSEHLHEAYRQLTNTNLSKYPNRSVELSIRIAKSLKIPTIENLLDHVDFMRKTFYSE